MEQIAICKQSTENQDKLEYIKLLFFNRIQAPTDVKLEHFFLELSFRNDLIKWDLSPQIGSLSNTSSSKISMQIFNYRN